MMLLQEDLSLQTFSFPYPRGSKQDGLSTITRSTGSRCHTNRIELVGPAPWLSHPSPAAWVAKADGPHHSHFLQPLPQ